MDSVGPNLRNSIFRKKVRFEENEMPGCWKVYAELSAFELCSSLGKMEKRPIEDKSSAHEYGVLC